ncbi:MAG: MaoC/PaaZ C-terminal domain-containing protein [Halovenus sp.]
MTVDPPEIDAIEIGDEGPAVTVDAVSREDFVRYAGASGDFNPLHYDDEYARTAGHDGVFGQGMFLAGILSRVVVQWFGVEPVSSFDVRFTSKLQPSVTIRASGVIEDIQEADGSHKVELGLSAETTDGTEIAAGTAVVSLPKRTDR